MNRIIAASTLLILLAACGQDNTSTQSVQVAEVEIVTPEVGIHSGLLLENMNTSVRPGDDFNAYVNGTWIDTNEIPADRASNSVGLIVHEEATANVKTIIEESANGDFAKGSDEQKVGALYASYMDMETRNQLGVTPLEAEFAKVAALENYEQLAVYFAEANKTYILPQTPETEFLIKAPEGVEILKIIATASQEALSPVSLFCDDLFYEIPAGKAAIKTAKTLKDSVLSIPSHKWAEAHTSFEIRP